MTLSAAFPTTLTAERVGEGRSGFTRLENYKRAKMRSAWPGLFCTFRVLVSYQKTFPQLVYDRSSQTLACLIVFGKKTFTSYHAVCSGCVCGSDLLLKVQVC